MHFFANSPKARYFDKTKKKKRKKNAEIAHIVKYQKLHTVLRLRITRILFRKMKRTETKNKIAYIVGWEQERPMSTRRVRTSHLGSARKKVRSRALCAWILSRDGMFLRSELRWDVLMRRADIGRSYAPSRDRTFLRAERR